ncbi:MAG: ABC transporter permease subunit [Christensenellales bacterium]|jgi:putative aldouronate transport system permease protein
MLTRVVVGGRKKKKRWDLFFLALPLMLLVIAFAYVPLAGWYFALIEYRVGTPIFQCEFVGLANFARLFRTPAFMRSIRNTLIFSAAKYAMLVIPAIFAILFNEISSVRFRKVVQTMSTLPHFISWVIVYGLTYAMFTTEGPVNSVLAHFGKKQQLLIDRNNVYIFQSALYLWKTLGWNSIIYVATIAGIDPQLYEAATIDGAGHMDCAIHITVPGIMPTFVVLMLLGVADFVNNGLDQYYVFQNAFTYNNLETLEMYTYKQGIKLMDYSYATAVGILKSVVSIVLLFVTNTVAKRVRGSAIV